MKSRRIFSILVLIGLVIISMTAAQAQNNGAAELKKRIFAQIASGARPQAAQATMGVQSQSVEAVEDRHVGILAGYPKKNALVGTWNVVLTFPDGSEARSTLQILPGGKDGEGSALHASEFSLAPPSPTLPEQGSWEFVGGTLFNASYYGYSFDEQLAPFGKIGFRHAITMGGNQETFTGNAVFEVIDLNGQILFTDTCQSRGVRQHPVAP
jgi:hypothetical protein